VTDREALMALNIHAFDQDLNGGWRPIAARDGCVGEAADLIRAYREFVTSRTLILYWHEGQLRAQLGETEAAIALFEQSRYEPADDEYGWNHYVDATIAFLRHDRPALEAARGRLAKQRSRIFPARLERVARADEPRRGGRACCAASAAPTRIVWRRGCRRPAPR
jgi:hypothetical protein